LISTFLPLIARGKSAKALSTASEMVSQVAGRLMTVCMVASPKILAEKSRLKSAGIF